MAAGGMPDDAEALMDWTRKNIIVALTVTAVLVVGVATGRHLLAGSTAGSGATPTAARALPRTPAAADTHASAKSSVLAPEASTGATSFNASSPPSAKGQTTNTASGLPDVATSVITPQVVHTATVDMRVGKGKLDGVLGSVAAVAAANGGYVDSSSMSGGTARRSPVAGTVVLRVPDIAFTTALAKVTGLGTVEDQSTKGKDVTIQSAQNEASIAVLQDEVTLLEKKLAEATDTTTFLSIEGQLLPVDQQLQRLQSAQAVLENSAALATITVHVTAPGAPVVAAPVPAPRAHAPAGTVAWRYLRHNSLAVLDGLAVGLGWALPVLILLALIGAVALRVVRRRRHAIGPA